MILCVRKQNQVRIFYFTFSFLMSPDLTKNNQFIENCKIFVFYLKNIENIFLMDHLSQNQTFTLTFTKLHTEF